MFGSHPTTRTPWHGKPPVWATLPANDRQNPGPTPSSQPSPRPARHASPAPRHRPAETRRRPRLRPSATPTPGRKRGRSGRFIVRRPAAFGPWPHRRRPAPVSPSACCCVRLGGLKTPADVAFPPTTPYTSVLPSATPTATDRPAPRPRRRSPEQSSPFHGHGHGHGPSGAVRLERSQTHGRDRHGNTSAAPPRSRAGDGWVGGEAVGDEAGTAECGSKCGKRGERPAPIGRTGEHRGRKRQRMDGWFLPGSR
jgi:hypothetical protein